MSTLTIRPITPADDAQMAAIVRSDLEEAGCAIPGTAYFDPQLDHLSAFYAHTDHAAYWVLSSADGTVYGGAGIGPFAAGIAELQKLYIRQGHRGHGDGQRLIDQALTYAQKQGYQQVYLETFKSLLAANHLYAKNGFKQLDQARPETEHSACDAWWLKTFAE